MIRSICTRAIAAAGLLAVCATGRCDITFGGSARDSAMGGAGIAIVDKFERSNPVNPAALALFNRRVKIGWPALGFRASGIGIKAAYQHLFGSDRNDAVSLARDFGSRESDFGASFSWGVRFGHLSSSLYGVGTVHVIPNQALQTWSRNANGDLSQLTGAERADMLGAGIYTLPTIGVAERVSHAGSPTRVDAGARIKLSRAVYSHYLVDANNLRNNTPAATAPELGNGTTLTKDGIGLDFGVLVHPAEHSGFSGALVVTNLIDPGFRFNGTDTSGNPTKYDLQPRSVSVGSAYQAGKIVLAADAVDLSRAYGNVQGRIGMEYNTRKMSFRGGYSSAAGFTAGFGWGFLQVAFGNRAPLEVTEFLRF